MVWKVVDIVEGDLAPNSHEGFAKIVDILGMQVSPIMRKSWCLEIVGHHNSEQLEDYIDLIKDY